MIKLALAIVAFSCSNALAAGPYTFEFREPANGSVDATLDASGNLIAEGSGTFKAKGANQESLRLSSGAVVEAGPVRLESGGGGYIEFADGTRQATASSGGGGSSDGNSMVFISSISANNSSSISILLPATYSEYEIRFSSVTDATDGGADLLMRVGTGGTPTYQTSSYRWHSMTIASDGAGYVGQFSDSDSSLKVADALGSLNGSGNTSGKIKLVSVHSTSMRKGIEIDYVRARADSRVQGGKSVALWNGNDAITAVRFLQDSGNIDKGEFILYGIKKVN